MPLELQAVVALVLLAVLTFVFGIWDLKGHIRVHIVASFQVPIHNYHLV
jgi:hypothetical protein